MNRSRVVMPAIIPHTADELRAQVLKLAEFAPLVHLDVMDGTFTPRASWPYTEDGIPSVPLPSREFYAHVAVHLMVQEPAEIGAAFARAGAASVTAQIEAFATGEEARMTFLSWKEAGAPVVGLAIRMDTPVSELASVATSCDILQVMSIERIGFQGQPFSPAAIERIRELSHTYPNAIIAVDGGVSKDNIVELARAGATRFAVGSGIIKSADPLSSFRALTGVLDTVQ